jgi:tRNA-dihydrouridine synthase 3
VIVFSSVDSQMAMANNIQSGQTSEWALMRRHQSEDVFGIQVTGNHPTMMGRVANIMEHETQSDFVVSFLLFVFI